HARRMDIVGINGADRHHPLDLGNRRARRHGHDGIEIAAGEPVPQVAVRVGHIRLDEGEVPRQRFLVHVAPAVDDAAFLAPRQLGAVAGRREKARQARARGADALGQGALRDQLDFYLAGLVGGEVMVRIRLRRKDAISRATWPFLNNRDNPSSPVPALFETMVRSLTAVRASACRSPNGSPISPNPLTRMVAPLFTTLTASSADS